MQEEAQERFSEWTKESWEEARKWISLLPYFRDTDIARQFKLLSVLGAPALPKAELLKVLSKWEKGENERKGEEGRERKGVEEGREGVG